MRNLRPVVVAFLFTLVLSAKAQTLEFESSAYNIGEAQGMVTLTVLKSGTATGTITVHYSTTDNPANPNSARAPQDYTATQGTLTFTSSETSKQITVPINEDAIYEGAQTFHVVLSDPTGGAALRNPSSAQVTILDNDAAPAVQFDSENYTVGESAGTVTVTITKSGATEQPTIVYYETRDGTARAPSDYAFTGDDLTASVAFLPSETAKQAQIPINDDAFREPNETFEVYFSAIVNGTRSTPATATVTIVDNDPLGQVPPAQALNISTRATVQTGPGVTIAGFIITGNEIKRVLMRGLGPSLAQAGVPPNAVLVDPVLELKASDGASRGTNDNWRDDPANQAQVQGTIYQPHDDREAVLIATLTPGAYTVLLTGKSQTAGIGLVEVYDANSASPAEVANLSTRGHVGMENDVMIGGFILGGEEGPARIVIRGIGPSLQNFGLNNVLADPAVELHDSNGASIVANDDWQSDPVSAAQLMANGLAPSNSKEAAIFLALPAGGYTAILHGKGISVGIGLVEIYNLR
jgi:hypothetical protein